MVTMVVVAAVCGGDGNGCAGSGVITSGGYDGRWCWVVVAVVGVGGSDSGGSDDNSVGGSNGSDDLGGDEGYG